MISVSIDASGALKAIDKAINTAIISKAVTRTTGEAVRLLQKLRQKKGRGLNGRFSPYSQSYKKERIKEGRQVSHVDLFFTGEMWGSIQARRARKVGTSYQGFISPSRASEKKKVFATDRQRAWWGFNKKEKKIIRRTFNRQLSRLMKWKGLIR